ncbi:molecular chaperone TorD family protein [Campylobacter volucris]|uniref:TorD/DmsD family molecular chaperone n=1 Tax=Campylobacter volucris TaxID=1031542 RepID=UPI00189D2430|nr:molecular chaperone TorD family protein [Campylobacter volucris]MBF7042305.1 molecular chaperone TorD family protein [Campylobacter volucris]MBF7045196.1 molecular chaperone TorD family protein [Campylobacter volucris]
MQCLAIDIFINFLENPPKNILLKKIKKEGFWNNWFLKNNNTLQKEALDLLNNSNEDEKEIGYDFTCLFLSDIDFTKAPPYASFYLDKDKEIFSNNSDKIKQIFKKHNFLNFYTNEPADSLINELLFIKNLIQKNDTKTLQDFLDKEFISWFFLWNKDLNQNSKTNFYKGLAKLMQDFFNELQKQIS